MGIELELGVLFLIQLLGSSLFARFEVETPALRKIAKWFIMACVTVGLYYWVGHYALIFPIVMIGVGTIFHFVWCKRNGIDPLRATPRKKYYELRKWKWIE